MVYNKVLCDGSLKSYDKLTYTILCMYANNKTKESWPSRSTLIKKTGISDKTLRVSLGTLEKRGYIKVNKRFRPDGGQLTNSYIII